MQVISFSGRDVLGSETITVSSTPIGLSVTKYYVGTGSARRSARSVLVSVEDADIRANFDSTVTVAADDNGHVFFTNERFTLDGYEIIQQLRMIAVSGDATVRVTYFG